MKLFKKTLMTASLAAILMTGTAKAQIIYGQPSMAQSLGQALGSGLSGNYSGSGYTTYYPGGGTGVSTSGGIGDAWGNFLSGRSNAWSAGRSINGSNINNSSRSSLDSDSSISKEQEELATNKEIKEGEAEIEKMKKKNLKEKSDKNGTQQQQSSQQTQSQSAYKALDPNTQLSVTGVAHVLDGITMTVGSTLVTLHGMIAPGNGQMCNGDGVQYACGDKARENLAELVNGRKVACTGWGNEGECVLIDDQTNINNVVLSQGIAQPE